MARIVDADEARDSLEWLQVKHDDADTPWWVMELLQCHETQPDGSISERVYGECVAKCLTFVLARSIVLKHNGGQLVHITRREPWP